MSLKAQLDAIESNQLMIIDLLRNGDRIHQWAVAQAEENKRYASQAIEVEDHIREQEIPDRRRMEARLAACERSIHATASLAESLQVRLNDTLELLQSILRSRSADDGA